MCGIAGIVGSPSSSRESLVASADDVISWISNRGPDNSGFKVVESSGYNILLAHTRLAVIDLSFDANQPMSDPSGRYTITFNGEIYNYIELKKELIKDGCSFITDSDTEVLLHLWMKYKHSALEKTNGMFAFAVVDSLEGKLTIARDRFGKKPLYWGKSCDDHIIFSSSVASVAHYCSAKVDVDYCARGLFYKSYEIFGAGSPFNGVHAVNPGHLIEFDLRKGEFGGHEVCWYELSVNVLDYGKSKSNQHSDLRDLLEDSVELRLRADVPIGVSISGGLDSSIVSSLALDRRPLTGFCFGAVDEEGSEANAAKELAESLDMDLILIWMNSNGFDFERALETTLQHQEAPFSSLSVVAQNEVFRTAKEHGLTVMLGGQGGDEVFAGYRKFFIVAIREAKKRKDFVLLSKLLFGMGRMILTELDQVALYRQSLGRYFGSSRSAFNLVNFKAPNLDIMHSQQATLSARQIDDVLSWSLPTLLRYEDRNSMGHGVETRLPLLDKRLVELGLSMPIEQKISNGYGKWCLRQAMQKEIPSSIAFNRKKRGFNVNNFMIKAGMGGVLKQIVLDNKRVLASYVTEDWRIVEKKLDVNKLSSDSNLLDEVLMLAWLVEPIRSRVKK